MRASYDLSKLTPVRKCPTCKGPMRFKQRVRLGVTLKYFMCPKHPGTLIAVRIGQL